MMDLPQYQPAFLCEKWLRVPFFYPPPYTWSRFGLLIPTAPPCYVIRVIKVPQMEECSRIKPPQVIVYLQTRGGHCGTAEAGLPNASTPLSLSLSFLPIFPSLPHPSSVITAVLQRHAGHFDHRTRGGERDAAREREREHTVSCSRTSRLMLKNLTFIPQLVEQQVRQPLVRVQGDDHVAREWLKANQCWTECRGEEAGCSLPMNKINESQLHCSGSTNRLHPEDVSSVLLHFLITKHDVFSPLFFQIWASETGAWEGA